MSFSWCLGTTWEIFIPVEKDNAIRCRALLQALFEDAALKFGSDARAPTLSLPLCRSGTAVVINGSSRGLHPQVG
jgi:hypothetical protein